MFLVSILTALGRRWCAGCAISFQSVHAIGSKLLWGFLVIECLFEEISGNTKLVYQYSITASCRCQVSREVLGFIISGQYGSASGKARPQTWAWATNRFDILGLSGGRIAQPYILMHKQVPQMEYFFCDTHKEEAYEYLDRIKARLGIKLNTSAPIAGLITGCLW